MAALYIWQCWRGRRADDRVSGASGATRGSHQAAARRLLRKTTRGVSRRYMTYDWRRFVCGGSIDAAPVSAKGGPSAAAGNAAADPGGEAAGTVAKRLAAFVGGAERYEFLKVSGAARTSETGRVDAAGSRAPTQRCARRPAVATPRNVQRRGRGVAATPRNPRRLYFWSWRASWEWY